MVTSYAQKQEHNRMSPFQPTLRTRHATHLRKAQGYPRTSTNTFLRDDTALIGTPKALAEVAKIINDCSPRTGLRLRWKKYHLYSTRSTINACRLTQNPRLPEAITIHEDLNIDYQKTPIGYDEFVSECL